MERSLFSGISEATIHLATSHHRPKSGRPLRAHPGFVIPFAFGVPPNVLIDLTNSACLMSKVVSRIRLMSQLEGIGRRGDGSMRPLASERNS